MNRSLLSIVLTIFLSSTLLARQGYHDGQGRHFSKVIEKLDLSSEQSAQIKEIRQKFRPEMKALRQSLRQQKEQFHQLLKESNDDSALQAAFDQLEQAKAKLAKQRFTNMLAIRKVLTPDQRQKFHELKGQRKHKHHRDRSHQTQEDTDD